MKTFDELREGIEDKENLELFGNEQALLTERLLRKGAALVIKATEKRHGNTADRLFQSAKQKLLSRPGESVEEQLKRQNEAFMDICDGLIAVRNQVSAKAALSPDAAVDGLDIGVGWPTFYQAQI